MNLLRSSGNSKQKCPSPLAFHYNFSLSLLFLDKNFANASLVHVPIGDASSSTPTRRSSYWSTVTAWYLSPPPFLRSTNARETTTASCTWSTPPRRLLELCVLSKKKNGKTIGFYSRTIIRPTLNSCDLSLANIPIPFPIPIQTGTNWTLSFGSPIPAIIQS